MKKRVYIGEDEYVDLPPNIVRAIASAPVQKRRETPAEYRANRPIKAFANPGSRGYGGDEAPWPFDYQRALEDARYRAGIGNAIRSDWPAQNWKLAARDLLDMAEAQIAETAYLQARGREPQFESWHRFSANMDKPRSHPGKTVYWNYGPPKPKPKFSYFKKK